MNVTEIYLRMHGDGTVVVTAVGHETIPLPGGRQHIDTRTETKSLSWLFERLARSTDHAVAVEPVSIDPVKAEVLASAHGYADMLKARQPADAEAINSALRSHLAQIALLPGARLRAHDLTKGWPALPPTGE
ncbi:MAG: hypothetical protein ACRC56_11850 [Bosea sp. (in: a-proteobacteria)]